MNGTRVLRTLRCGACDVGTVAYLPGFALPEHSHGWSCFRGVLRGRFDERGTGASGA